MAIVDTSYLILHCRLASELRVNCIFKPYAKMEFIGSNKFQPPTAFRMLSNGLETYNNSLDYFLSHSLALTQFFECHIYNEPFRGLHDID